MAGPTPSETRQSASSRAGGRRDFFSWVLSTWAGGVIAATFYPVLRFLVPPDVPEATSITASAGKASTLAPNSGKVIPFGAQPAIVIRTQEGELRAFTAICTHLSCTVQYRSDLQEIWCACHNGHYDLTGRNVSGPPPKPLRSFDVAVKDDEIIVSRNS